ncbi:hypothetical protein D3C75_1384060 [compost metagenome]
MHPLVNKMNMLLQLVAVAVQIILVQAELVGQDAAQALRQRRALGRSAGIIQ